MQRFSLILFWAMVVIAVAHQLFSWQYNKSYPKEEIEARFEPITRKYGVKIVYEIGDDFFSPIENPPIPAGPPKNSKVRSIRHRVLLRYPSLLQKAFDKYPVEVIKKYINALYFVREIDTDGIAFGGTYDPFRKIIYLVDNGVKDDEQAMRTIHHELSSLFLKSHSFFVNPWTDHNPKGFTYLFDNAKTHDNLLKIYENILLEGGPDDYEMGFVTDYGKTDFENDFNEYSAMIFTYPQKFKEIMDKYPRVRGKFLVWLEFYQKIDQIFTESYLFGKSYVN